MNKLMLGAAAVALTLAVSPAFAADNSGVKLGLGGYFKGYGNYSNEKNVNAVDMLRDTEVHFGGETTLDNGLTVGAHIEATADGTGDPFLVDESYAYFAGSWGRVNAGKEDGAAYLLQVAAPSADDNIDGLRQYINPTTFTTTDYAADTSKIGQKLTYLSPVFSGFQGGVSYTPNINTGAALGLAGNATEDESASEAALRYEGMVGSVGLIAGGGYTATTEGSDEWNLGADMDLGAFGLGAVYKKVDGAVGSALSTDVKTWVVGTDYTTGPFKIGASYLNNDAKTGANSVSDRYAAGVTYSYGPGMTFRGSVGYTEAERVSVGKSDNATTVSVGTQINF